MKKIIRLAIVPLLAAGIISCQDKTPELEEMTLETNALVLQTGKADTVLVNGGSGEVSAVSDNEAAATIEVIAVGEAPAVRVNALESGSAVVTVSDLQTGENQFLSVSVQDGLVLSSNEALMQVGHGVSIEILSGNGDYTVFVDKAELVAAVVEGAAIKIEGLAEGSANVTVKDNVSGEEAVIAVTVEGVPVVKFTSSYRFGDLRIIIDAPEEYRGDVWIDLDADGVMGEGEAVTVFGELAMYPFDPAVNPDIAIYGRVTKLSLSMQSVTTIDIIGNQYLEWLDLNGCNFSEAGLALGEHSSLHYLNLNSARLSSIDVSGLSKLDTLNVSGNYDLAGILDVSGNPELVSLACIMTGVTGFNFGDITKVENLNIWSNEITDLDLSNFARLTFLNVYGNPLTSLDVSANPKLKTLTVGDCELKSLDLSGCAGIEELHAYDMFMADASFLEAMPAPEKVVTLNVRGNAFTEMDLSGFTGLKELYICTNQLTSSALDAVIAVLPERETEVVDSEASKIYAVDLGPYAAVKEGNEFTNAHLSALIAKGWWVYDANTGGDQIRLKEGDIRE